MRLRNLLEQVSVSATVGDTDVEISSVVSDSRRVVPGSLFAAYRGVTVDGNAFISAACERGANAVIGETPADQVGELGGATYIQVPDGREALAWVSAAWNGFPARRLAMVGVTGTDGKTTTAHLLYQILRASGRRVGLISTVNAVIDGVQTDTGLHTTTPDAPTVQRLLADMCEAGVEVCVLETTSHGLAHHRVTGCDYDVAVVTNITHEHLDLHGSLEAYRAAKASLFAGLSTSFRKPGVPKVAVLNRDDSSYDYLSPYPVDVRVTYGLDSEADVVATDVSESGGRLSFRVRGAWGDFVLESPLTGDFNVYNILAAACAARTLGVDVGAVARGVAAVSGVPGRMERIEAGQPFAAIVDFAHTPKALEAALKAARRLTSNRLIVVFGCAGLRDQAKRPIMGEIASRLADYAILTAEDPRTENLADILASVADGCRSGGGIEGRTFERVPDRGRALARAVTMAAVGDVVLACGKGHEQSMCFGDVEYPWDDRAALRSALKGTPVSGLPTAPGKQAGAEGAC